MNPDASLSGTFDPRVSENGMAWTTIRKAFGNIYNTVCFPRLIKSSIYLAHLDRGKMLLGASPTHGMHVCNEVIHP